MHYLVDPANPTEIHGATDYRGFLDGAEISTPPPGAAAPQHWDTRKFFAPGGGPLWDLYPEDDQRGQVPLYHEVLGESLAFVGTVRDPAAVVRRTHTTQRIHIDELLQIRQGDLLRYADLVFFSSCKMSNPGGIDFWVNMSLRSRLYRTDVDAYYQWTPPPPWRNIPVWIVRVDNGNEIRYKAPQDDWTALKEAQGRFSIDVAYSADEVEAQMELAHAQDDFDTLAAIDIPTAPVNHPWPEHNAEVFNGAAF